jgi:transcriptional regulator with XRE-family HTH domain
MTFQHTNNLKFGDRLKKLRDVHNLSQGELAARIGVTQAYLSKLESNQSLPGLDVAVALSRFFDVTLDELAGLTRPEQPSYLKELFQWFEQNQVNKPEAAAIKSMAEIYLDRFNSRDGRTFGQMARDIIVGFHPIAKNWNGVIYSNIRKLWLPVDGMRSSRPEVRNNKISAEYYIHIEVAPVALQLERDFDKVRTHHIVILNKPPADMPVTETFISIVEQILLEFRSAINMENTFWYGGAVISSGLAFAQIYDLDYLESNRTREIKILATSYLRFSSPERMQEQPVNLTDLRQGVNESREGLPNQDQINMGGQVGEGLVANSGQISTNQEKSDLSGQEQGGAGNIGVKRPKGGLIDFSGITRIRNSQNNET